MQILRRTRVRATEGAKRGRRGRRRTCGWRLTAWAASMAPWTWRRSSTWSSETSASASDCPPGHAGGRDQGSCCVEPTPRPTASKPSAASRALCASGLVSTQLARDSVSPASGHCGLRRRRRAPAAPQRSAGALWGRGPPGSASGVRDADGDEVDLGRTCAVTCV